MQINRHTFRACIRTCQVSRYVRTYVRARYVTCTHTCIHTHTNTQCTLTPLYCIPDRVLLVWGSLSVLLSLYYIFRCLTLLFVFMESVENRTNRQPPPPPRPHSFLRLTLPIFLFCACFLVRSIIPLPRSRLFRTSTVVSYICVCVCVFSGEFLMYDITYILRIIHFLFFSKYSSIFFFVFVSYVFASGHRGPDQGQLPGSHGEER